MARAIRRQMRVTCRRIMDAGTAIVAHTLSTLHPNESRDAVFANCRHNLDVFRYEISRYDIKRKCSTEMESSTPTLIDIVKRVLTPCSRRIY